MPYVARVRTAREKDKPGGEPSTSRHSLANGLSGPALTARGIAKVNMDDIQMETKDDETERCLKPSGDRGNTSRALSEIEDVLPPPRYVTNSPKPYMIDLRGREVLLAIANFFLVSLVVALIVIVVTNPPPNPKSPKPPQAREIYEGRTCLSRTCLRTAAQFMANMNPTVNPCNDFWAYACGGWVGSNTIPPDKSYWSIDSEVDLRIQRRLRHILETRVHDDGEGSAERKAKLLYRKCMDVGEVDRQGVDNARNIIRTLGGWAATEWRFLRSWDVSAAASEAQFSFWAAVFFTVWVGPDDKQPLNHIIQLDQGGLGLPSRHYYLLNTTDPLVKAYKQYMVAMATKLGATTSKAKEFAEKSLAAISLPQESPDRLNPEAMYNKVTIKDMQALAPKFSWLKFLRKGFPDLTESDSIVVTNKNYMKQLSELLAKSEKKAVNMYLVWRVLFVFAAELSEPFRKMNREYEEIEKGIRHQTERWRFCLETINDWFGHALGAWFIKDNFSADAKTDVLNMIRRIKSVFASRIDNLKWMDAATRSEAKRKLRVMTYEVGYPDFLLDLKKVDKFYENFRAEAHNTYYELVLRGIHTEILKNQQKLKRKTTENLEWEMNPQNVNAYYHFTDNKMVFTAGIVQWPRYHQDLPKYINYGGIGATIGHEILHGFDDSDMKCFADYYSKYKVNGSNVKGDLTKGENVADIGGLRLSYQAYKEHKDPPELPGLHLTPDQLFFVSYGQNWCSKRTWQSMRDVINTDSHAPNRIRLIGTLSQMPEFSTAFNCEQNSYMAPKDTCNLW